MLSGDLRHNSDKPLPENSSWQNFDDSYCPRNNRMLDMKLEIDKELADMEQFEIDNQLADMEQSDIDAEFVVSLKNSLSRVVRVVDKNSYRGRLDRNDNFNYQEFILGHLT